MSYIRFIWKYFFYYLSNCYLYLTNNSTHEQKMSIDRQVETEVIVNLEHPVGHYTLSLQQQQTEALK